MRLLVRALGVVAPTLLRLPVDGKPPLRPSLPLKPPRLPGVEDDGIAGGDDCALSSRFLPTCVLVPPPCGVSRGDPASSADRLLFVGDEAGLSWAASAMPVKTCR